MARFVVPPRGRVAESSESSSVVDESSPVPGASRERRGRALLPPTAVGLAAGIVVMGATTYRGRWFPGSRQGGWFFSFPGLGASGTPKWVAFGAYYGGLVLLGVAWIWFFGVVRRTKVGTASVLAVCALWALPLAVAPPIGSDDAIAYVGAGRLVNKGLDPYEVGIVALGKRDSAVRAASPFWWDSPQPYGPLYVRSAGLASSLGGSSVRVTVLVIRAAGLVCLGLLVFPLTALARRFARPPPVVLAAVLGSPLILVQLVGGAHNEALMLVPLVTGVAVGAAGLAATGARRVALVLTGAALCGVGAAVKIPAFLGAAVLGWLAGASTTWRRLAGAAIATAAAGVVVVAVSAASGLGIGWVHNLDVPEKTATLLSPFTAAGWLVQHLVPQLGSRTDVVDAFRTAGFYIGLAVCAVCIMSSDRLGLPTALGGALLVLALTTPVVWPWYFTWGIVFFAIRAVTRSLQLAVAGVNLMVTPLGPGSLDVNGHPTWGALVLLVVAIATVASVARSVAPVPAD